MRRKATDAELAAIEQHDATTKANVDVAYQREQQIQERNQAECAKCGDKHHRCMILTDNARQCADDFGHCAFAAVGADHSKSCPTPK